MEEYIKIQKIINDLYLSEFPIVDENKRYLQDTYENKQEFIDFFVKRLKFCDKIKPKKTSLQKLSQSDICRICISDKMRIELINDCVKSKFFNDINKKYMKTLNKS